MMLKMTIDECQEAIKGIFRELYPNCTVTYSYPGIFERPPLPYVLLDFGKVDSTRVDSSFSQDDGLLYQTWHNSMALTVDMVENCKTTHTNGKVMAPKFRAVADLAQAVAYINSPMLEDRMLGLILLFLPNRVLSRFMEVGPASIEHSVPFQLILPPQPKNTQLFKLWTKSMKNFVRHLPRRNSLTSRQVSLSVLR